MTDQLSLFPYPSEDFIRVAAKRKRIDAGLGAAGAVKRNVWTHVYSLQCTEPFL